MNQQDIFKRLANILLEINQQYAVLAEKSDDIDDLELDLFLANTHYLSEHVEIIKKLNVKSRLSSNAKDKPSNSFIENQHAIPLVEEEYVKDIEQETSFKIEENVFHQETEVKQERFFEFELNKNENFDHQFEFEKESVEAIFDRPLSVEETEIIESKKRDLGIDLSNNIISSEDVNFEEDGPEPFLITKEDSSQIERKTNQNEIAKEEKPVEQNTPKISSKVSEAKSLQEDVSVPSFNDLLAGANKNQNNPSGSKITDLKQAINLNNKILFIKDLFNGYNMAYAEAIDLLNKMDSFDKADEFLKRNYADKYLWSEKTETVDRLYEILSRKFL